MEEPLATIRKVLKWLCILPAREATSKHKKLIYIVFSVSILTISICGFTSSLIFIVKYFSTNLEDCLYALFQVSGNISNLYMVLIAFILRHRIAALFERLWEIYDASKKSMDIFNECFYFAKSQTSNKIFVHFKNNSEIFHVNLDAKENLFRFLAKANNKSQWIWSIYSKFVMASIMNLVTMCSASAIVCWMNYKMFVPKCIYRPYRTM